MVVDLCAEKTSSPDIVMIDGYSTFGPSASTCGSFSAESSSCSDVKLLKEVVGRFECLLRVEVADWLDSIFNKVVANAQKHKRASRMTWGAKRKSAIVLTYEELEAAHPEQTGEQVLKRLRTAVGEKSLKTQTAQRLASKGGSNLPHGRGSEFPAVLRRKGGLDRFVLDMMRPLADQRLRIKAFSKLLLEMHTKEHARLWVAYLEDPVS
ncbi:MAG: hypothetical protein SGPRY_001652 [Prymnesium sp.]